MSRSAPISPAAKPWSRSTSSRPWPSISPWTSSSPSTESSSPSCASTRPTLGTTPTAASSSPPPRDSPAWVCRERPSGATAPTPSMPPPTKTRTSPWDGRTFVTSRPAPSVAGSPTTPSPVVRSNAGSNTSLRSPAAIGNRIIGSRGKRSPLAPRQRDWISDSAWPVAESATGPAARCLRRHVTHQAGVQSVCTMMKVRVSWAAKAGRMRDRDDAVHLSVCHAQGAILRFVRAA